jgi:hypothetical protein
MKTRRLLGVVTMSLMLVGLVPLWLSARTGGRPHTAVEPPTSPWAPHLERLDRSLAANDRRAASRAWQAALGAALASRRWEPMIAVGDAALRFDDGVTPVQAGRARARQAYLTALLRARASGSEAGMRRVADAFAALGDDQAAERARRMAGAGAR